MSGFWIVFSLLAVLCDVLVGYIDEWLLHKIEGKKHSKDIDAAGQLILISGFFGFVLSVIATVVVIVTPFYFAFTYESFVYAFLAGILEVLWLIPYFYAIERGGALNTTPLFQTIPIFSLLIGMWFFAEIPALMHIVATIIILNGAFLLNYSPKERNTDYRTVILMLLSSAIISMGYFLFKDASETGNFLSALCANGLGMGALSALIWFAWKPYREQFLKRLKTFDVSIIVLQTANEGLYSLATVLNRLAIVLGPSVVVVSAMDAFHPVFTLGIGALLARFGFSNYTETFNGTGRVTKTIAIAMIVLGAVLVAF
jgi:drug/metabolite transporter (DMT)-like permease